MSTEWILSVLLFPPALIIALPAIVDSAAWLTGIVSRRNPIRPGTPQLTQPLVFLIPAHNESLLISRCVQSLRAQRYPAECMDIVVVADNCSDDTASLARAAGATVLERTNLVEKGKGHAIGWALLNIELADKAAIVVVDADTIVEPEYSMCLMHRAPLQNRVMQTFDGASNEFENWLTRMAGLLTRNRYEIALELKARAGLGCPMTGDGIVLGTDVLQRHPWRAATITEGWELYARLTLEGILIDYVPEARLYAQETRSLGDSGTQRQRWTAGRLAVLRMYFWDILTRPEIPLLQRLDLLAELTSLGPVLRGVLGALGILVILLLQPPLTVLLLILVGTAIVQPCLYSVISLIGHPEPGRTLLAFLRLPVYAGWRLGIGLRSIASAGTGHWVRTQRREEAPKPKER